MRRNVLLVVCCLGIIAPCVLRSQDTICWSRSSVDSTYWFDHNVEDVGAQPSMPWKFRSIFRQYIVPLSERGAADKYIYGISIAFWNLVESNFDSGFCTNQVYSVRDTALRVMLKTGNPTGSFETLDSCSGLRFKIRMLCMPQYVYHEHLSGSFILDTQNNGYYPVYEYYFRDPISLGRLDTFWIGYDHEWTSTTVDYDRLADLVKVWYDGDSVTPEIFYIRDNISLDWTWDTLRTGSGEVNGRYLYDQQVIFPIMSPPTDTDQVACPVPEHLRLLEVGTDYAALRWDTVAGTMGYQLAVVEAGGDPDTAQVITRSSAVGSVFGLRPGMTYEAYVRSRGLHRCWMHDTILWSAWSEPCVIQMADTGSHDTTGIVGVDATRLQLWLKPNPAHSVMTVETNCEDTYELTIQGDDGRRRMQQKFRGTRTEVNLSSLSAGHYVLTLRSASGIAVKGFVKE